MYQRQRIPKRSTSGSALSKQKKPFTPSVQARWAASSSPSPAELEGQAFEQQKFEAFGLQLKQENGSINPVEQERLGVLQAKMDEFWARQRVQAQAQPDLLNIMLRRTQAAAQDNAPEPSAPVESQLAIGHPNDPYEQEADRVAAQVVEQVNAPERSLPDQPIQSTTVSTPGVATRHQTPSDAFSIDSQATTMHQHNPLQMYPEIPLSATATTRYPVNTLIQRQVLSKLVPSPEYENVIHDVIIGGRTPSPFPGTMGAHSTAWIAHLDAVRRMLVNTEFSEGSKNLIWLAREELNSESSPLLALKGFLDDQHKKKLEDSEVILKDSIKGLEEEISKEKPEAQAIKQKIHQLINDYLTYTNYLPMSTVKGGDPSGHGEGVARSNINTFEYVYASMLEGKDNRIKDEIPKQLSEEIKALSKKGVQGKIKNSVKKKFDFSASKKDGNELKKILTEQLWTLFAAETPEVFFGSQEKDRQTKENRLLIWQKSLENFLRTIQLAYPHAYDFTKMHTKESQKTGLEYALKEAKTKIEKPETLLPGYEEEAIFRDSHDEVTLSDLKQSGSGFMATILLNNEGIVGDVNLVGALDMIGRTKSPFSGTMGAHTTAWAAHLDAVRNILTGKTVFGAITTIESKAKEAMKDPGLDLSHQISEKHQHYLFYAYEQIKTQNKTVDSKKAGSLDEQVDFLEQYIFDYLTFVNFLPLSTIEVGSVPGGKSEGKHRNFLLNYEQLGNKVFGEILPKQEEQEKILQEHILGLFDDSALKDFPPLIEDREELDILKDPASKDHPLCKKFQASGSSEEELDSVKKPDARTIAYKRFYSVILEAYPRSLADSGLLENKKLAKEALNSMKTHIKNEKIDFGDDKKIQYKDLLKMNNCLINAIKQANSKKNVTEKELLEIRQRIGELGTMLFATPRTLSIICEVLGIDRGVVIIYQDRYSEDFGDTENNPILVEHTGSFHFQPFVAPLEVEKLDNPFDFFKDASFEDLFAFDLEDLSTKNPQQNNIFNQLHPVLLEGTKLSIKATFLDDNDVEMEDNKKVEKKKQEKSFVFEGKFPRKKKKSMRSRKRELIDFQALLKKRKPSSKSNSSIKEEPLKKKRKIEKASMEFNNGEQKFSFDWNFFNK